MVKYEVLANGVLVIVRRALRGLAQSHLVLKAATQETISQPYRHLNKIRLDQF